MAQQKLDKQRLVFAVLKFLEGEIQAENENDERRESMEVAVQCLETVYDVSLSNPENESLFGPVIELLPLVSEIAIATEAAQSINFSSWINPEQQSQTVPLTDDMRQQADKLKNEGNEFVKQEKYREALESYNAAIKIDGNNAIYYCNRAAAHNKLNNNDQALSDCFRSIEIDPNYSKAYGRLGVIYLSLDKVHEALDAFKKAHTLEPNNDNYKQSIKICEERLISMPSGATASGGPNIQSMFGSLLGGMGAQATAAGGPDMMSFFNNPSLMNMAMQFVQNPQVQGLMANLVTNLSTQDGGDVGIQTLLETGQRMASQLSANNPDLIQSIRRTMGNQAQTSEDSNQESSDTSNGTSNSNNSADQDKPSS